jgi:hypothetical protein
VRLICAALGGSILLFSAVSANAGVAYDVAVRAVNQSTLEMVNSVGPVSPPVVTHYFVEDGKVRIGGSNAKSVYIFKDKTMYVIDNPARVVHVLKHATLSQFLAHYAESVQRLEDAAASAAPEARAEAERKAADMREANDRMQQPVQRTYRVTSKFESVDGHACRIWEESEKDAKRLELCVAPANSLPGSADVMNGLKTLSEFRQGSNFALGVDFGLSEWWPNIAALGGVPILVREYKYDSQVSEVMLTGMLPGPQSAALFSPPDGYQVQEGPDYTQWYVR